MAGLDGVRAKTGAQAPARNAAGQSSSRLLDIDNEPIKTRRENAVSFFYRKPQGPAGRALWPAAGAAEPLRWLGIFRGRSNWLVWGLALGLGGLLAGCAPKAQLAQSAPPEVEFVQVEQRDVSFYEDWVGTLQADVTASISAQVSGYITNRAYTEGAMVTNGQVLFQIDSAPFEATLAQARAQLVQAQAQRNKTKRDAERYQTLAQAKIASQQDLDDALQADESAAAQVDAAAAQVHQAELSLGFTTIRSPVDGVAGLAKAQLGDLVGTSTGPLTTVAKVDPIRVSFTVSEQRAYRMLKRRAESPDLGWRQKIPLELFLANDEPYPEEGYIRFSANEVDPKTGTIQVIGEFPNARGTLVSGMFARIRVMVGSRTNALIVPQRAVAQIQTRQFVALLDSSDKVHITPVTVGETVSNGCVVECSGIRAGDRIVAEGIQKVSEGLLVKPMPFKQPGAAL